MKRSCRDAFRNTQNCGVIPASNSGFPDNVNKESVILSKLPLAFVENRGQVDSHVSFYSRYGGSIFYVTERGFSFKLQIICKTKMITICCRATHPLPTEY